MKKTSIVIICLFSILFFGCPGSMNGTLTMKNNSRHSITVLYSNSKTPNAENNVAFYIDKRNIILPDSTYTIVTNGGNGAWHKYIESGTSKKLYLFVFSVEDLKNQHYPYTMSELCRRNRYLKMLEFSERDLAVMGWSVYFSG